MAAPWAASLQPSAAPTPIANIHSTPVPRSARPGPNLRDQAVLPNDGMSSYRPAEEWRPQCVQQDADGRRPSCGGRYMRRLHATCISPGPRDAIRGRRGAVGGTKPIRTHGRLRGRYANVHIVHVNVLVPRGLLY